MVLHASEFGTSLTQTPTVIAHQNSTFSISTVLIGSAIGPASARDTFLRCVSMIKVKLGAVHALVWGNERVKAD
jgi:hypothetical protein